MSKPLYELLNKFANEAVCPVSQSCQVGFVAGAFWAWGEARIQIAQIITRHPPGASAADLQLGYSTALQRAIEHHCQGLYVPPEIATDCPTHADMLNKENEANERLVKEVVKRDDLIDQLRVALDETVNYVGRNVVCAYPDCGCDGARNCDAIRGPSSRATEQNIEGKINPAAGIEEPNQKENEDR